MAFPKYESYKDSGVEWLGEIPQHWSIYPIRAIFQERNERNLGTKTDFVLSVMKDKGVIPYDEKGNVGNKKSDDIEHYKVVYPGDLVVNKMNAIIGSLGVSEYYGVLSQVYFVLYPKDKAIGDKDFLGYLFKVKPFQKSLIKISKGIMELRESIEFDEFKKLLLPLPPLAEQQKIVAFLNQITAEIDEAIAKKQRLIELLQEQKAILINQAVTKGLNPKAPMRDSGVEWIGEIPEHWATAKIKHIAKFYSGGTPSKEKTEFWDGDIPWVSPKDMKHRYIKDTEDKITQKALEKTTIRLLDTNTVLIVVRGMILARKIPVALTCFPVTINQDMKALVLDVHCLPEYLVFLIEGVNKNLSTLLEESGHGTKTLPTEKLGAFVVPIPPKDEQVNIINFIKENDAQTELFIATINKQVLLLEEFRCNIIASVVTGKIKV